MMTKSSVPATVPLRPVSLPPEGNARVRAHATSVARSKSHSAPPSQLSTPRRDFHLESFFSPIWMPGPHVFSFAEDGTVVRPKTFQSEPYPGYYAQRPSRHKNGVTVNHIDDMHLTSGAVRSRQNSNNARSYADVAKVSLFNGFPSKEKPWKNVAITEEDDIAFAAAEAERRVSGLEETRVAEGATLVDIWPPVSYSPFQPDDSLHEAGDHSMTDENEAPQLSYASSADTSESDEEFSIPVPEQRGSRVPFRVLTETAASLEEEPLEKVVGFGRLRRKAPPALKLQVEDLDEDGSRCFLFDTGCVAIEPSKEQILSPLTAVPTVLSATLLRAVA